VVLFLATRPEGPGEGWPRSVCGRGLGGPLASGRFLPGPGLGLWVLWGRPGLLLGYRPPGRGYVGLFRLPDDLPPGRCLDPPPRVALAPVGPFALGYRAIPGFWRGSDTGALRAYASGGGFVLLGEAVALWLEGAEAAR